MEKTGTKYQNFALNVKIYAHILHFLLFYFSFGYCIINTQGKDLWLKKFIDTVVNIW